MHGMPTDTDVPSAGNRAGGRGAAMTPPSIRLWPLVWVLACTQALAEPPSFEAAHAAWRPSEAVLLDRNGVPLHVLRTDFRQRRLDWTALDRISPVLVRAVVAAEDHRFYRHRGVDWRAVTAAAWRRLGGGRPRGASTLSMQVAAMLEPQRLGYGRPRTLAEKLRQIPAALTLERHWTKAQILETYLNRVSFRGELVGVAAAAEGLYDKAPSGLTEAEALLLAALLPAPNAEPPRVARRACALAARIDAHSTCAQLHALAAARLSRPGAPSRGPQLAPQLAHRILQAPGERRRTTLDVRIQRLVAETLASQLRGLAGRNVRDGAGLVVDNASGEILAYVGSAGPHSRAPQVDGVAARRQAGSTLKPFLYELALEKRYLTAASLLDDSPLDLQTSAGRYIPQNYDRDFKGLVSIRTALAGSLNVPAVRTLLLVGVEPFRDRLWELGYRGLVQDGAYYGYSLALGSAEVSLLEQANAYRTLANGGRWSPLRLILDEPPGGARRVLSAEAAYIVTSILADRGARALSFGLANPLAASFYAAVKTGTSKEMRDNWCVGYTDRYTVAVWVGNFENEPMREVSGITGAAPAWSAIVHALHRAGPPRPPAPPPALQKATVRFRDRLEPSREEWFLPGTELSEIQTAAAGLQPPRLSAPPDGVILALDPDIPPERQAVSFRASGYDAALHFELDGRRLAAAARPYHWFPVPGHHRLRLLRSDGQTADQVEFEVRGLPARPHRNPPPQPAPLAP